MENRRTVNYSFQDSKNASLYEPRIDFIRLQLNAILSVVDLESGGRVVHVDGFRLKNLSDWRVPSRCDPVDIFGLAGSRCTSACCYCFNRGNPPEVAFGNLRRRRFEEYQEMLTRIHYFSPISGTSLFTDVGDIYEVLGHSYVFDILRRLREKTSRVFRIMTNGMTLTGDVIARLAEVRPVYLYFSLTTVSPQRRRAMMHDPKPEVAIEAARLLKESGIPYALVIVAWPFGSLQELIEDMSATVGYADSQDAHIIEVHLPGYSRQFSPVKLFDDDEVWSAVVAHVRKLRQGTTTPIVVMPAMYEENLFETKKNLPKVVGVIKNSPACIAGVRGGDVVRQINGVPIMTRPQARDMLSVVRKTRATEAEFVIERQGQPLLVRAETKAGSYPYSQEVDAHLGVVMMGTGLRLSYIETLRDIIEKRQAKQVLFLSSRLVKPTFEQALSDSRLFPRSDLHLDIKVPRNNFFGGNICMGDLLTVQDFIDSIHQYIDEGNPKPDLVVIPSSPFQIGAWKRDLTGRVYLDIERETGVPVELLECENIYD